MEWTLHAPSITGYLFLLLSSPCGSGERHKSHNHCGQKGFGSFEPTRHSEVKCCVREKLFKYHRSLDIVFVLAFICFYIRVGTGFSIVTKWAKVEF